VLDNGELLFSRRSVDERGARYVAARVVQDSAASLLIANSVQLAEVSMLLGHSELRVTATCTGTCNGKRRRPRRVIWTLCSADELLSPSGGRLFDRLSEFPRLVRQFTHTNAYQMSITEP